MDRPRHLLIGERDRASRSLERGLAQHLGRCDSRMEGRSGTGRPGVKYFYYVCQSKDRGLTVVADEIEGAVLGGVERTAT